MDNHTPEFTPEQVDAQMDRHFARSSRSLPSSLDAQILDDLQQMYQEDEHSLRKVWQRLGLENDWPQNIEQQPEIDLMQQAAGAHILDLERIRPMRQARERSSLSRTFSLLVAACIVALITGSMLFIFHMADLNKHSQTTTAGTPDDIYASNATSVFKFDTQTHQILWQRQLEDVHKIIPSEKVVYFLQGSNNPAGATTHAASALDASSGKILWTYTFTTQKQNYNIAFTMDMVLAQDRLYIGWQNFSGGATAQIYVLKASNGSRLAVYPATTSVGVMAANADILAAGTDSSLQAYDLLTGKILWHIPFQGGHVLSLKIVNSLIYVVISADGEKTGLINSLRIYKALTGEQISHSITFASDTVIFANEEEIGSIGYGGFSTALSSEHFLDITTSTGNALSFFAIDQNNVYFGTTQISFSHKKPATGRIYAYNIQSNKQLWSIPINGAPLHQPVIDDGVIYAAVDGDFVDSSSPSHAHIIAINTATGTVKWQQTLEENHINEFTMNNGVIIASSYDIRPQGEITSQKMYMLQAPNGKILSEDAQHVFNIIVPAEQGNGG